MDKIADISAFESLQNQVVENWRKDWMADKKFYVNGVCTLRRRNFPKEICAGFGRTIGADFAVSNPRLRDEMSIEFGLREEIDVIKGLVIKKLSDSGELSYEDRVWLDETMTNILPVAKKEALETIEQFKDNPEFDHPPRRIHGAGGDGGSI